MGRYSINFKKYTLKFKKPVGTSRGFLTQKDSFFLMIKDNEGESGKIGIGEISVLPGLSPESNICVENVLKEICANQEKIDSTISDDFYDFPAIRFGFEMAFQDLKNEDVHVIFPSNFTQGKESITFNGLIWMGEVEEMLNQIKAKLSEGFGCIKIKIGAISFDEEIDLIKFIRRKYSKEHVEIRVDANGGFEPNSIYEVLEVLASLDVHSIEQPIKPGRYEEMASICKNSPVPIALDEELIGVHDAEVQRQLLIDIKPHFIVIKPSLLGGFLASEKWISQSKALGIKWWVTSALESNIGLSAIAQWAFLFKNTMAQGLGTGSLFQNNIPTPVVSNKSNLNFMPNTFFNQLAIINS